jgi:LmbE family N-acetylglucosaminyl deacetylase
MNVLVLAPHPDDEVIGCGGAVIKHILKGDKVSVLFITSGEAGNREENPENLMRVRESEAQQASEILGMTEVDFLHQPDGYLAYNSELLNLLTAKIRAASPDIVYLPHSADAH